MTSREQIQQLQLEGKTAPQIQEITGLSKSTVHYHLHDSTRQKTTQRNRKQREERPGLKKLYRFFDATPTQQQPIATHRRKALTNKSRSFQQRTSTGSKWRNGTDTSLPITFKFDDVVAAHPEQKCYLTGRTIDFKQTESFSFDHIQPTSKGGSNTIGNLGVTCPAANQAKNNLTVEEFIQLCKEVLENFGYVVAERTGLEPVHLG